VDDPVLPPGYRLREARFPEDACNWTRIRNEAFAALTGSRPIDEASVSSMPSEAWHLNDLSLIVEYQRAAVGIIRAVRDDQPDGDSAFIGPVAVDAEHRGRGIGRAMLREVIHRALTRYGYPASLSVNAENDDALRLYLQEGFARTMTVQALILPL
jgi:mycothiol synthase